MSRGDLDARKIVFKDDAMNIFEGLLEKYGLKDGLLEIFDDVFDAKEKEGMLSSPSYLEQVGHIFYLQI